MRPSRLLARLAGFLIVTVTALSPAWAARGQVTASELPGFGRLVFTFDGPVGAKLRTVNSVLILDFDQPVSLDPDKLPVQVPSYIGVARLDPDGKSMRIGLNGKFRADLKQAGERVFLDLLGPRWQGMPPPLPQEVIDELVRRARQAEDRARRIDPEKKANRAIELRVAHSPRFRRAIFTLPRSAHVDFREQDGEMSLLFDGDFEIAEPILRSRLAGMVDGIALDASSNALRINMRLAEGYRVRGFREDDSYTLDFSRTDGKSIADASPPVAPEPGFTPPRPDVPGSVAEGPRQLATPEPVKPETLIPPSAAQAIDFRLEGGRDPQGFGLRLAGLGQAPVAILQRGPNLIVLIETVQTPGAPTIPPELKNQVDGFQITRLRDGVMLRMVPKIEGTFWLVREGDELIIQRGKSETISSVAAGSPIRLQRVFDGQGRDALEAAFQGEGKLFSVEDPLTGARLVVAPLPVGAFSSPKAQSFAELVVERTLAGFAALPLDEAVTFERRPSGVLMSHEIRLNLSAMPSAEPQPAKDRRALLIDPDGYEKFAKEPLRLLERTLLRNAAEAPRVTRPVARLRLAQAYLAHQNYPEAQGVLDVLAADDPQTGAQKTVIFARALAATFMGRFVEASRFLAEPQLADEPEQRLLQAIVDAKSLRYPQAVAGFRAGLDALDRYPDRLQGRIRHYAIAAAIEAGDAVFAREQLHAYEQIDSSFRNPAMQQLLAGRLAELEGRAQDAFVAFTQAALSPDRRIEAEARFGRATSGLLAQKMTPDEAKAEFETLTAIWRRSETEVKALARLGDMYAEEGRWREAFLASQRATALLPNHPITRRLEEAMGRRFESIFLDADEKKLSKVEALAIYQEFRTLVPPGRRGDEIARRLADRLFDLDLVNEAADILEHQVRNRLEGVARSVVATRLAVMHLQNRQPLKALTMLNETRLAGLPAELKRARTLLEARSLGEVHRSELAIEILANESGDDVDRLRADINWKGKHWREAGEAYERVLGDAWQGEAPLSSQQRLDVLRAGLAYVLAEEALSLDRLRQKFLPKMATTDDAGAFNLIAFENYANPRGFRDAARNVVNADTLTEFLSAYRKRYPETGGEARPARSAPDGQRQSALPQPLPDGPGRG